MKNDSITIAEIEEMLDKNKEKEPYPYPFFPDPVYKIMDDSHLTDEQKECFKKLGEKFCESIKQSGIKIKFLPSAPISNSQFLYEDTAFGGRAVHHPIDMIKKEDKSLETSGKFVIIKNRNEKSIS